MTISDAWLRAVVGKPYLGKSEITYRDGLGVRISPKGKITWIYRVNFVGRPIKMKLGEYPSLKIRDALRERDKRAELVAIGVDPRSGVSSLEKTRPHTLDDLVDYWVENNARENVLQWKALKKMFDTDVSPYIGSYPAYQLELFDYMPIFKKAKERVSPKHSANLMSRIKSVLGYAVRHGLLKYNALAELKKVDVGSPTSVRRAKQDINAVPVLWKTIASVSIHESNKNFLRLVAIFACRSIELRMARKRDFDLEANVWTVPEEHNKIRKSGGGAIRRPIPELAAKVIKEQFLIWPEHEIMFPPVNTGKDQAMSDNSPTNFGAKLGDAMAAMGYPRTTNHDMRRTARNIWESQGVGYNVAEAMLGHKVHTGVQSHYLDYEYLEEQRVAYENWCSVLLGMTP